MKFEIKRTSGYAVDGALVEKNKDGERIFIIELETIEDFANYVYSLDEDIIFSSCKSSDELPMLEIYDDYRE